MSINYGEVAYPANCENGIKFMDQIFKIIQKTVKDYGDPNSSKVIEYKDVDKLRETLNLDLNDKGTDENTLLSTVRDIVQHSVKSGHRFFFNQMFQGIDIYGLSGALLIESLNTSPYTYEMAPVFVLMEQLVFEKMRILIGFNSCEGIFCPGGSISNMYAMNVARYHKYPKVKCTGVNSLPNICIFTSATAHYSIIKGASFMGIGSQNAIEIPVDEGGRMVPKQLESAILEAKSLGSVPIMVNATVGSTVYGSIDPLQEIADICEKYDLWLHVDAAFGGSILFSDQHRDLLAGIERADSVTWNLHKMMGVPLQCSAFLTRHKGLLRDAHGTHAGYLFQQDKFYDVSYDTGDMSIQCGRKVDVFKFWLAWKAQGRQAFAARVNKGFSNARYMAKATSKRDGFWLVLEPETVNVCFWYIPTRLRGQSPTNEWWNEIHTIAPKIKERMVRNGSMMVGYQACGVFNRKNFFRFVIHNSALTFADMDKALDIIDDLGHDL